LSGTTRVSRYQKKHSPTYTRRGHQISLSAYSIFHDAWHPLHSSHAWIHATSTNKWLHHFVHATLNSTTFPVYPLLTTSTLYWILPFSVAKHPFNWFLMTTPVSNCCCFMWGNVAVCLSVKIAQVCCDFAAQLLSHLLVEEPFYHEWKSARIDQALDCCAVVLCCECHSTSVSVNPLTLTLNCHMHSRVLVHYMSFHCCYYTAVHTGMYLLSNSIKDWLILIIFGRGIRKKLEVTDVHLSSSTENVATLPCKMPNWFIWWTCIVSLRKVDGFEKSLCVVMLYQ